MLLTCWYSQTGLLWDLTNMPFYTITNLQGSQTLRTHSMVKISFTPLQTYKVLKPYGYASFWSGSFTPLQGSQTLRRYCHEYARFYTITNLQGSQTVMLSY